MIKILVFPALLFLNMIALAQVPSDRDLPQKEIPSITEKERGEKSLLITNCEESAGGAIQKAECFFRQGTYFQKEQNLEKAKVAFEKATALFYEKGEVLKTAHTLNRLGVIHLQPTTYWRALEYYQKAQTAALEAGSSEEIIKSYEGLANVYEELYMYKDALEFRRKYEEELAEFYQAEFADQLEISEEVRLEKEARLLTRNLEIEALRSKSEKLNTQRNIGIITTSFAGLLAFLAVGYSIKRKREPAVEKVPVAAPIHHHQMMEEEQRLKNSNLILEDLKAGLTKIHTLTSGIAHKTSYLPDVKDNSENVKFTAGEMLERIGDLLWMLNPGAASLSALIDRIQQFAQDHLKETGIKPVFHISEELPETDITREGRTELYAVIKESLQNVAAHSAASKVILSVNLHRDMLLITIIDNGNGFVIGDHNTGSGLRNMKENMEKISGVWEVSSKIGQGTMISFSVSLNNIKV